MAERLEVNDGAGQGAGDSLDGLDLGDDELAQVIHVGSACADDHVVGTGDILRRIDAADVSDFACDLGGLPHLGLDQDVRLNIGHVCASSIERAGAEGTAV